MPGLRTQLARIPIAKRLVTSARAARLGWAGLPKGLRIVEQAAIPAWPLEEPEPGFPGVVSQACTDTQMRTKEYRVWGDRFKVRDIFVHRKQWEWFFIAQALLEGEVITPGNRGLGFGVGTEPLVPWLAQQGCEVMATDFPGGEQSAAWQESGELATALADLNLNGICQPDEFLQRVQYREVDMRAIPDDLRDYDFCWSSCALEHLGSLEAGMEFVVNSLATVRSGALVVHTTELNLSSNEHTTETGTTVLYRRRDIEELVRRLEPIAEVLPLNFNTGTNPNDLYVAPNGHAFTQLRLQIGPYVTTSFGLILRKR